ncbi:uncharacterized protein CDAR_576821 [Caerostris darwini]|uniref:Uncharacterized protein n=1 Tax=Caerostris darwini TaxID=1538125 RepID=A0AAV4WND9_9ARAC|nr:uncharacterized protein CDAR_576821 [Caerostris darwini]
MVESNVDVNEIDFPLAKGIVGAFNDTFEKLCKTSSASKKPTTYDTPEIMKAKIAFSKIDKDATEKELTDLLNKLGKVPNVELDAKIDTNFKDFCESFKKLSDLVERKLSMKTLTWLEIKEKERSFPKENAELSKTLKDLQEEVDRARLKKTREISKKTALEEQYQKDLSSSADLKSQHPFFLKANTKEQIELIETCNERKLAQLRKDQEKSERKFIDATMKHRDETLHIIQETMETKAFLNWLKDKDRSTMKKIQDNLDNLWNSFKDEMQNSEELCAKYKYVDAEYVRILKEKRLRENEKKKLGATIILQRHFRRFLEAKRKQQSD